VKVNLESVAADRPVKISGMETRVYATDRPNELRVDGLFKDWENLVLLSPDYVPEVNNSNIDIEHYTAEKNSTDAFFYMRVDGDIFAGTNFPKRISKPPSDIGGPGGPGPTPPPVTYIPRRSGEDMTMILVDTNISNPEGMNIGSIRADFMVVIKGINGRITERTIYGWTVDYWNMLQSVPVMAENDDSQLEVSVPLLYLGSVTEPEVIFITTDWTGLFDSTVPHEGLKAAEGTKGGGEPGPMATAPPSDPGLWTTLGTDYTNGEVFTDQSLNITEMFFADSSEYLYVRLELNSDVTITDNTWWIYLDLEGDGDNDWLIAENSTSGVCSYQWDGTNWGVTDIGCDLTDTLTWADIGSGIKVTTDCSGLNDCIDFALEKTDYSGLDYDAIVTGASDDTEDLEFNPTGEGSDDNVRNPTDADGGNPCDTPSGMMGGEYDCQAPVAIPEFEEVIVPLSFAVMVPVAVLWKRKRNE
jgi:hypothetical protein